MPIYTEHLVYGAGNSFLSFSSLEVGYACRLSGTEMTHSLLYMQSLSQYYVLNAGYFVAFHVGHDSPFIVHDTGLNKKAAR